MQVKNLRLELESRLNRLKYNSTNNYTLKASCETSQIKGNFSIFFLICFTIQLNSYFLLTTPNTKCYLFTRKGVICTGQDILDILQRNLLGECVSNKPILKDINLTSVLLISSPKFLQIINLYLEVITSKILAPGKDKSIYDIVPCSTFKKISQPVGVNNFDTVQVYHDIMDVGVIPMKLNTFMSQCSTIVTNIF